MIHISSSSIEWTVFLRPINRRIRSPKYYTLVTIDFERSRFYCIFFSKFILILFLFIEFFVKENEKPRISFHFKCNLLGVETDLNSIYQFTAKRIKLKKRINHVNSRITFFTTSCCIFRLSLCINESQTIQSKDPMLSLL